MRTALLLLFLALLSGCSTLGPGPYLELRPKARYVEVYPYSSTTLEVEVLGRHLSGPVRLSTSGLPPGVGAVVEDGKVEFVSEAVTPGAYRFNLTAEAPTSSAPLVREVPLPMFVPATGNILDRAAQPLDVTVKPDDALAMVAELTPAGGSAELTASDGTRYTLTVPPGALLETARLRLTPIMGVDWPGFASARGVRIEPNDLRLWRPARLELTFAMPPSGGGIFRGFQTEADGREFFLKSVAVQDRVPALEVTRGGVVGVGWVRPEALETTPVPTRPEDWRLERLQRLQQPDEVRLSELTYSASLSSRLNRLGVKPDRIGALLPEVAIWDADLPTRAWGGEFAGNLGLTWALLAEATIASAEQYRATCGGADALMWREELRRWHLGTEAVPAWREALGDDRVRALEAALAACP
ncbi:MAG TPA: hypothetical protein VFS50_06825 [Meiothermus sp.]|nr:hypothetical protein [Meiothermus sp.]